MENKWRAARYGLEGKLIDFGKQQEVPVRQLIGEIREFVADVVEELGSEKEIAYIDRILETGSGADRQPATRLPVTLERLEAGGRLHDRRNRARSLRGGGTHSAAAARGY